MNKVNQKVSQKIQGKPQGIIRSKKKHVKILQSSLNLPPKNVRPVIIPVQTCSYLYFSWPCLWNLDFWRFLMDLFLLRALCVSGQFSIGHFSTPIFWQTFPDQDISRPGDISRPRHFSTQTFLDPDISRPGQKSTRQFLTDIKVGLVTHSWHLP